MKSFREIRRFRIRHFTKPANNTTNNDALLPTKHANAKARVLRSLEHLMPVQAIERLRRVLARDGTVDEDRAPAGVQVREAREVVYIGVDDDPLKSAESRRGVRRDVRV